jgi:hypothetical protein
MERIEAAIRALNSSTHYVNKQMDAADLLEATVDDLGVRKEGKRRLRRETN